MTLPQPTKDALEAWLTARGTEAGPLFVNFDRAKKGGRLTGAAVYYIVSRLGLKAGLVVRPHGIRHLAITSLSTVLDPKRKPQSLLRHVPKLVGTSNNDVFGAWLNAVAG